MPRVRQPLPDLRPDADRRRADSERRRQHVLKALAQAIRAGADISVSGLARAAGVDRTYFYRHRDLLERIHAAAASSPHDGQVGWPGLPPSRSGKCP
ncbi:DUF6262 family protein [Streptomyces acidicola]|uniref:DUF6262 family protein n=1 Tax=Streptomyces acidicola TaxID=2596892 RepID=UPI00381CBECB